MGTDIKNDKAQCLLAPATLFGIGVGSEICGDCGGATVTLDRCYIPPIYTNCKTCGGSGRVAKAKPMPNASS